MKHFVLFAGGRLVLVKHYCRQPAAGPGCHRCRVITKNYQEP